MAEEASRKKREEEEKKLDLLAGTPEGDGDVTLVPVNPNELPEEVDPFDTDFAADVLPNKGDPFDTSHVKVILVFISFIK